MAEVPLADLANLFTGESFAKFCDGCNFSELISRLLLSLTGLEGGVAWSWSCSDML